MRTDETYNRLKSQVALYSVKVALRVRADGSEVTAYTSMLSSSNFAAFFALYPLFYLLLYFFTKILPLIRFESGVFGQTEAT